ncbi:retinol dehydrogenase 8-like [Amphiura filiformis]|uniref:retinol dehydrogenase 8-like n=1 Tax=Amphiura filiformis TaxID=82378 RepID=UPI003B20C207
MAPKVVVITGCSTGIGLETAALLASDKDNRFKVFATMRNLAKQAQLEIAAGSTLDKTLFIRQLDVTKEDSIVEFIDKINREEGGVDILINNAGVGQAGVVEKVAMSQIRTVYETNVFGLIRLTQAVIPGMKSKRAGHIINVGSMAGLFGYPFCDIYVSSKFAVEGFSESIAPLLKKFNISVSVIEPGPVQTAFAGNIATNDTGRFSSEAEIDADVDEKTRQYYKDSFARAEKRSSTIMQTGAEIASIIQDAILSDNPHLHYPTSEVMGKLAASKYIDPTGDSVLRNLSAQQQWE